MTRKKDEPRSDEAARLSRRGFLFGAGAAVTAGATVPACVPGAAPEGSHAAVLGPGAVPITLRINGKEQQLSVSPERTLADVLRLDLGLTGTKIGCERGACGACTVWLDGAPVCSCMTFALDAAGRAITTIEGLAKGEELHPVQAAFVEHDAAQCGFCTPGMVMSCAALVERKPNATLDDVKGAVSGNLCRCGTYPKVFTATLAAARRKGASHG